MQFLKVLTDGVTWLKIGPFVDSGDGNTEENELVIAAADVLLSKNGAPFAGKHSDEALTGTGASGFYDCLLDSTDLGTLGRLQLRCHVAGALMVYHEYMVVPANVYDSMFGAELLEVQPQVGAGAISWTININDADGVDLSGAQVWVSTDSAGANIVQGPLTTGADGNATFLLDASDYYYWVQKDGYNSAQGVVLTVS